ncbi:WbqC family protein [Parapedobacter deserti]|uniref:WbqC family protein n=1 Tax=Parapedobacter deserti TaxID=1912957 RepID=A0ABV7JHG3_9SPHI
MDNHLILPAFYLPPVPYFSAIQNNAKPILIEQHENYIKQSYRTRASVYSANGQLDLIVPVQRGRNGHTQMKDVQISNDWNWQRLHWMSLQTAYRSSAYFEYYEDDFAPFYTRRYEWLFEYNMEQLEVLMRLLKINREITFTQSFREDYAPDTDFRQTIHPKRKPEMGKPYYQVFESKHGFIPGLSVVDLLFNHGPQSKDYL